MADIPTRNSILDSLSEAASSAAVKKAIDEALNQQTSVLDLLVMWNCPFCGTSSYHLKVEADKTFPNEPVQGYYARIVCLHCVASHVMLPAFQAEEVDVKETIWNNAGE